MTLRIRPLRRAPTAFSVAARKPGNKTSTIISSSRCLRGGRKSISVRIMRFRVRYRRAAVSSPGNFDGDADFEILPRPVHGDSRRPEGVCERKASPVAKRKAGDLRRLPQLAHENRAHLVQNACAEVEHCNQLIDFAVAKPPILQLAHNP